MLGQALDYRPDKRYDLTIYISTLEHVGWDEVPKEPQKILSAVTAMKALLRDKGKMLVTVPLGYNDFLDQCIKKTRFLTHSLHETHLLYEHLDRNDV